MRILLSTDTVGGVWDHVVTLARELHTDGHEVLVAALGEARDERLAALPAGVEVTWRSYRLEWMPGGTEDVEVAGAWLSGLSRLWRAQIVHLNQFAYAARDFAAPVIVAAHSDVLSWWNEVHGSDPPAEWIDYRRTVRSGLAGADVVVAPTHYQSALLHRHLGRAADHVIPNGVPAPDDRDRTSTQPLLLTAGRAWDLAKGVRVLDEAIAIGGSGMPPAHLLGETRAPNGDHFEPRHLIAHGRVGRAEVDEWMARAAIYVAPSLYEPFGLAPLEAALRGCALVLSDIGSFRELWDGCAVFFPRGDAVALARVLQELIDDHDRIAALAASARLRARRRYSADRMARAYVSLYRELAGIEPARRHFSARARTPEFSARTDPAGAPVVTVASGTRGKHARSTRPDGAPGIDG